MSSEMAPLAKSGGLGDVVAALPKALRKQGHDARVVMPLYKRIKEAYRDDLYFIRWAMIKLGWRTMYSGLFKMDVDGVPVYFIDNEYYFGHDALYVDYSFDIERFAFFQRAALEAMGDPMEFEPDILHLNDWQTGMVPVLLEAHYKSHGYHVDTECVMTIHNLKFQGIHGRERVQDLMELPDRYMSEAGILKDGVPNFMKAGIQYANRVTTVSPTYAREIMMDYYGEGLNGLLGAQAWKVVGILNGIDTETYQPETDKLIHRPYGRTNFRQGKESNKKALQKELGLEVRADVPMVAMISRLAEQKGLDLLLRIADEMLDTEDIQLVVVGTGEHRYEEALRQMQGRHPDKMRAMIEFNEPLAHKVYAASDIFLMPSIFEPCGLSQMIAMRYGSLPVVRETGGLKDTVEPYNQFEGTGTGFSFANINAHELLFTVRTALDVYRNNRKHWANMVREAMRRDYSWDRSAEKYIEVYTQVLEETGHGDAVNAPLIDAE